MILHPPVSHREDSSLLRELIRSSSGFSPDTPRSSKSSNKSKKGDRSIISSSSSKGVLSPRQSTKKRPPSKDSSPAPIHPRSSSNSKGTVRLFSHFRGGKNSNKMRRRGSTSTAATVQSCADSEGINVVQWMQNVCPDDVLPKILAYAGPKTISALNRTNRVFHQFVNHDDTWRDLCEELYKWQHGQEEPSSWKDYYRRHPCVPIDFPTIHDALAVAGSSSDNKQDRSICILLRPGRHMVSKPIEIQTSHRMVQVSIETMRLPGRSCSQAFLLSKSRRRNEPIIYVRQGEVCLKNLILIHHSAGVDIWNGNAALQIRPEPRDASSGLMAHAALPRANVTLTHVEVMSTSGRGIVVMDDAHLSLHDSYVHDCAATGVYVGGPTAYAELVNSDIATNGAGNTRSGGIARGHSGIYLEQGSVDADRCNVSQNTGAGISVIARDARLRLQYSDVISNGGTPLELPPESADRHFLNNNRISAVGMMRPTSLPLIMSMSEASDDEDSDWDETDE